MIEFRPAERGSLDGYLDGVALCWVCHRLYPSHADFQAARSCNSCHTWVCNLCAQFHPLAGYDLPMMLCRACYGTD